MTTSTGDGGLSQHLREKIARAVSKWPGHVDGFTRDCVYSEAAHERWKAASFAQADEILEIIERDSAARDLTPEEEAMIDRAWEMHKAAGHDSDCAVHNEPASPNGPCDCARSALKATAEGK